MTTHVMGLTQKSISGAENCPIPSPGSHVIQSHGLTQSQLEYRTSPSALCTAAARCPGPAAASAAPAQVPPPQEVIPPENLGVAQLGSEQFSYNKAAVPSPPTMHLSGDISRLCREWEESNLLVVNGRGIPIKYWGEFYKKGKGIKTTAWDALRVEWGNWKVGTYTRHLAYTRSVSHSVHCRGTSHIS